MEDSRGYMLSHQRVVLDVNFAGVLSGTAYLTINPTNPALRTIYLHASPLLQIRGVTLSSPHPSDPLLVTPASYTLSQPFTPLPTREPPLDIKSHTEIKRKTWAALGERDEGELAISVSGGWVRVVPGERDTMTLAPIEIKIDYRLAIGSDVVEGIVFEQGDDKIPHMYLSPTTYNSARIWTPCVDSLWERCTWELEFIVPTHLEGGEDVPVVVVSSGELIEQTTHPHSPSKTIFYYLQSTPTSVQHIQFAAGPFEMITVAETPKTILGFCLPGDLDLLTNSTSFLPRAMSFYSTEYGSYPFTEYKLVFVGSPRNPCSTSATLSICSSDLLYPPEVIDQAIETRQILSLALIQQWVGINIIQRTIADTWVIHGLALYLNSLFLKHLLGNNEYRFRLKRDIDRCVRLDQGDQWPLCMPGQLDAPDVGFINLKAPLVMHILDRHLAKAGTSLGLARVIPRIFLAALSDELSGNTLSTQFFFRTCRKVSGVDLQAFQDQWVLASGCPRFKITTNFVRKKFHIEFNLVQSQPAATEKSVKRPAQFFEGSLTVRIHEADGAPFEHVLDIKTSTKTTNLPFNTKYKRTRRSGNIASRFSQLRVDEAEEQGPGDEEATIQESDNTETFAYPPWEDEEKREEWRVAEWTEEQAEQMLGEGGGYEWIRIDPDFEWLAQFDFAEKPWYWISQLQGDRDVAAQLEAVQNMSVQLHPIMATELARTVLVSNFYYRVRMEAANALINFCNAETDFLGIFLLPKIFEEMYCHPEARNGQDDLSRVRPNDFSDYSEYFVKKAVVGAISGLRDMNRASPQEARRLLLHILSSNDNTSNKFSDSHYVAALVTAIGNALSVPERDDTDRALRKEAVESVDRIMTLDRLVPSFHNVVSEAGLKTRMKFVMSGNLMNDSKPFLGYTREGNYESLRLTAFDCLLLCRPAGRSAYLTKYIMQVIESDPSLTVRRHLARALSESMLMSLAIGEVQGVGHGPGIVDINPDSGAQEMRSDADKQIVKALRKDFGAKEDLREALQAEFLASFTGNDDELRFALLKAAEIMTTANTEPIPGTIITLATPAVETPAAMTPRIRLSLSAGLGGPAEINDGYPFPAVTAVTAPANPIKLVFGGANKKAKSVHKSQSRGLPHGDRAVIGMVLKKMVANKSSVLFRNPVDPIRDNAPDYLTIIKKPMDLATARAKLDNGMYSSRSEFVADMRQIVQNCLTYNSYGTQVYLLGQEFEGYFNNLWARSEASLDNTSKPKPVPAPRPPEPLSVPKPAPATTPTAPGPVKLKIKPLKGKSVSIDTTPQWVPPMAPPPVPSRKPSGAGPTTPLAEPTRKRKDHTPRLSDLDDMLGAEIDAIEKTPHRDPVEELLESGPKKKKQRDFSPDRQGDKRRAFPTTPIFAPKPESPGLSPAPQLKKPTNSVSPRVSPTVSVPPPAPDAVPALPDVPYSLPRPPADLPATVDNTMPFKLKRSKNLIGTLQKAPTAGIFLRPVNPILDGCPSYLTEIKEPMDLGTIAKKVESKKYERMGQVAYDIELVFKNCRQFNVPGDSITLLADAVEAIYWREWPKAVSTKMLPAEKKDLSAMLGRALRDPVSLYFREAVDPIKLGIPNYFEIVPQQDARDLSLIKSNLDKGLYSTIQKVDDEVDLMLENCYSFNGEGPVVDAGHAFHRWWLAQRAKIE